MMSRPLTCAVNIFAALLFFYGCAGARPATDPQEGMLFVPAVVQPAAEASYEEQRLSDPEEEQLLLEDDLAWGDESYDEIYMVPDPLENFNRAMFVLNDKLYFYMIKPVGQGYRAAVPEPARRSVRNFFTNLRAPVRIVNNILQGKVRDAEAEWARFLYNSTVGVLGFGNPADAHPDLALRQEDMGQTLAFYGIGNGFYIFWPAFGPSTLRDSVGSVTDWFLNPVGYVEPVELSLGLSSYNQLNNLSFRIGDYEDLKRAALDPYISIRDGYIQLRKAQSDR
jgi:phospholipid-binding lipoprotein MlaA